MGKNKISVLLLFLMGNELRASPLQMDTPEVHFALDVLKMGILQSISLGWP
jgi:hypothetical protein